MSKIGLLFDGDILLYRAGFAAEKRIYIPSGAGLLAGMSPMGLIWSSAKEAKEFCIKFGFDYKTTIEWKREPEPVENAIHNLNSIINTTEYVITNHSFGPGIICPNEVSTYIFLTGNSSIANFREGIYAPYKANRDPSHKPIHLEALKIYLLAHYNCVQTEGCEADDYLSQAQTDMENLYSDMTPVIVSLDKDLNQIRGYKYNFVDKKISYNTSDEGTCWFFQQMVIGDKADNIPGLKGYGEVKTANLFSKCTSLDSYGRVALQAYISSYGSLQLALPHWNRNCELLWIWRKVPDECPYKIREKIKHT